MQKGVLDKVKNNDNNNDKNYEGLNYFIGMDFDNFYDKNEYYLECLFQEDGHGNINCDKEEYFYNQYLLIVEDYNYMQCKNAENKKQFKPKRTMKQTILVGELLSAKLRKKHGLVNYKDLRGFFESFDKQSKKRKSRLGHIII